MCMLSCGNLDLGRDCEAVEVTGRHACVTFRGAFLTSVAAPLVGLENAVDSNLSRT